MSNLYLIGRKRIRISCLKLLECHTQVRAFQITADVLNALYDQTGQRH